MKTEKMSERDTADAARAALAWCESQGISAHDAARVFSIALMGLIVAFADSRNDALVGLRALFRAMESNIGSANWKEFNDSDLG